MILIKNKVSSIPYLSTKSLVSRDAYQAESLLSLIIVIKFQAYKIQLSLFNFPKFYEGLKKKKIVVMGFLTEVFCVIQWEW